MGQLMDDAQQQKLNTNSNRTRDHLANERTYLAWMRTAISMMGFGVVIVRLRYLLPLGLQGHSHGWQLGLVFALVGVLMVLLSTVHYFHVRHAIDTDSYEPAGRWIIVCSVAVTLIGVGVVYYLFTSPLSPTAAPPLPMP